MNKKLNIQNILFFALFDSIYAPHEYSEMINDNRYRWNFASMIILHWHDTTMECSVLLLLFPRKCQQKYSFLFIAIRSRISIDEQTKCSNY